MGSSFRNLAVRNFVHSALLVASMVVLCSVIGWLVGGVLGLMWLSTLAMFVLVVGPRISPQLVLRMYNAKPIREYEAPGLIRLLRDLAASAGLPAVPELYYIPSSMANAFAVGARGSGAVAVTDGLLRRFTSREIRAILAHEVGHLRSNDGWVMSLADSISQIVNLMSWIGQFLLLINLPLFLLEIDPVPWLLVIVLVCAPTLSALLQLALSRTREFEADVEAVRLTGDPQGLVTGLEKLERLSGNWFERVFMPGRRVPEPSLLRTHPPTGERIRRLLDLEDELFPDHAAEHEEPTHEFLSGRRPMPDGPRWHVSRFWY
jgi:heat shock protein HtpX